MNEAEQSYKNAIEALRTAEAALGATPKENREAREAARQVVATAAERVRAARESVKADAALRGFAGVSPNSPLFMALHEEQLDGETIKRLEQRALQIQTERNETAAARKREKEARQAATPPPAVPTPPPSAPLRRMTGPQRAQIEVVVRRPAPGIAR